MFKHQLFFGACQVEHVLGVLFLEALCPKMNVPCRCARQRKREERRQQVRAKLRAFLFLDEARADQWREGEVLVGSPVGLCEYKRRHVSSSSTVADHVYDGLAPF